MEELIVSSPPFNDESLGGYITRLTSLNGYTSHLMIYRKVDLMVNSTLEVNVNIISPSRVSLGKLSKLTGVKEEILWGLTYYPMLGDLEDTSINSTLISAFIKGALLHSKIKYCPLCLVENLYYRKVWNLTIYNVCEKHKCILKNKCPKCEREIFLRSTKIGICQCGFDLRMAEVDSAPEENGELEQFISSKIKKEKTVITNNPLSTLEFPLFTFVIMYFARFINGLSKNLRNNSKIFHFSETTRAFHIFNNWPMNFYQFLDKYRDRSKIKKLGSLSKEFGHLYKVLNNKFRTLDQRIEFIPEEFENYLTKHWDGGLIVRRLNKSLMDRRIWVPMQEATSNLRISHQTLKRLIDNDVIITKVHNTSHKDYIMIQNNSLNDYKELLSNDITYSEACALLNISNYLIGNFVESGLLKRANNKLGKNRAYKFVERTSVTTLLERISSKIISVEIYDNSNLMNFWEVANKLRTGLVNTIQFVLNDEIKPVKNLGDPNKGLKNFYFLKSDIISFQVQEGYNDLVTLTRKLDAPERIISHWIKMRFIKGEKIRGKIVVTDKNVDIFKQTYITIPEISVKLQNSYHNSTLKKLLSDNNLYPLSGKEIDGQYKYLYKRKDVEDFIKRFLEKNVDRVNTTQNFYNLKESSIILETKREAISHWIKQGLLKGKKVRNEVLISSKDLNLFNEKFILIGEIGNRLYIWPDAARRFLEKNNIRAIPGSKIGDSGKHLYLRKEVESLLP